MILIRYYVILCKQIYSYMYIQFGINFLLEIISSFNVASRISKLWGIVPEVAEAFKIRWRLTKLSWKDCLMCDLARIDFIKLPNLQKICANSTIAWPRCNNAHKKIDQIAKLHSRVTQFYHKLNLENTWNTKLVKIYKYVLTKLNRSCVGSVSDQFNFVNSTNIINFNQHSVLNYFDKQSIY
jgi:hypothetical protein